MYVQLQIFLFLMVCPGRMKRLPRINSISSWWSYIPWNFSSHFQLMAHEQFSLLHTRKHCIISIPHWRCRWDLIINQNNFINVCVTIAAVVPLEFPWMWSLGTKSMKANLSIAMAYQNASELYRNIQKCDMYDKTNQVLQPQSCCCLLGMYL